LVFALQVEGLVRLMEGEHIGPFNLGNPGEFTMIELAEVCIHFPGHLFSGVYLSQKEAIANS
jgi:hypothetical protein